MKYFTYDLFVAQNTETISDEQLNQVDQQWEQNGTQYRAIYRALSERLPQDVFNHFNSWGFHD
ncbi:hypothetical protein [Paenibacillus sp. 481]|uniref:hypothetical protein n=1 Tax=Paenibacillus sp. 481 TaxID=2835869 RepID=UPI001E5F0BD0|nr:hypothetical protein [Paenibacillus sp. 481]UHA73452.1 hypothetical protein KIK04_23315 [Paenibacillus sp. 481]